MKIVRERFQAIKACEFKINKKLTLVYHKYINHDNFDFMIIRKEDLDYEDLHLWTYIPSEIKVFEYTEKFLKWYKAGAVYMFKGEAHKTNPLVSLKKGRLYNFYIGNQLCDGWLYNLDGTPLIRKIRCEFPQKNYKQDELFDELKHHRQWFGVKYEDLLYYSRDDDMSNLLVGFYLPTQKEINNWILNSKEKYPTVSLETVGGPIHKLKYISKHAIK